MNEQIPLTEMQRKFAESVFAGHSLIESYKMAGYSVINRKTGLPRRENGMRVHASKLHASPQVQEYLNNLRQEGLKKTILSVEETNRGMKEITVADIGDYFTDDGEGGQRIKNFHEMTPEQRRPIKAVKFKNGQVSEFSLEGKSPVLFKAADILGMVTNKVELSVSDEAVFQFFGRAMAQEGIDLETVKKILANVNQQISEVPKGLGITPIINSFIDRNELVDDEVSDEE